MRTGLAGPQVDGQAGELSDPDRLPAAHAPPRTPTILVEQHAFVREALRTLLEQSGTFEVVLASADLDHWASGWLHQNGAPLLICEFDLPRVDPFRFLAGVRASGAGARTILFTRLVTDSLIDAALAAGVAAYLLKSEPPQFVLESLRAVVGGQRVYSAAVAERLEPGPSGALALRSRSALALLTNREMEILRAYAAGQSKKEIAGALRLSVNTVENHVSALMRKLAVHDRVALARLALREALVTL